MWFEVDIVCRGGRDEAVLYLAQGPLSLCLLPLQTTRQDVMDAVQKINDNSRNGKIRITVDDVKALRRAMEAG